MSRLLPHLVLLLSAPLVLPSVLPAQPPSSDERARELARRAEAFVEDGQHAAAARTLVDATVCDARGASEREVTSCRVRLYYTRGWVEDRWAEADPQRRRQHLERAAGYFARAHSLRPGHRPLHLRTVRAWRDAGRVERALELWRPRAERSGTAEDLLILGDLQRAAGEPAAARATYFRAETLRPSDRELHRRLLATYLARPGDVEEHKAWCERLWRQDLDSLAVEGLEVLLENEGGDDARLRDWVLLHWTDLETQTGFFSPADLEDLPAGFAGPGLEELERLSAGPATAASLAPGADFPWWTEDAFRRHVATEVLRDRSRREEEARRDDAAIEVLQAAARWAPDPREHDAADELSGRQTVWVDVQTDLAALYQRLGEEEALQEQIHQLIGGKNRAYLGRELASIHRFHVVLGVIFTERERWSSASYDNAIFQLRRAVETSRELAQREGRSPPPVPALYERLGLAYSEVDADDEAGEAYFQASLGYLEVDELDAAETSLRRAESLPVDRSRLRAAENVLDVRRRVSRGEVEASQLVQAGSGPLVDVTSQNGLPEEFLSQQRFKVFADLAERESAKGNRESAADLARAAAEIQTELRSATTGDRLRVLQIQRALPDLPVVMPDAGQIRKLQEVERKSHDG